MAKIDDYTQAFKLGKEELSNKDVDLIAQYSGSNIKKDPSGKTELVLNFLNRPVTISWPDLDCVVGNAEELPIQQKVLLVHYLCGAWTSKGARPTGTWIAYQEIPDGRFYLDAFQKRAKHPLVQGLGNHPDLLVELAAQAYGAGPFDHGDVSVVIPALPLVPLALILWKGDDEFPPDGNILFDQNISGIFSAEDVAWLAGMAVYPLVGMAKARA